MLVMIFLMMVIIMIPPAVANDDDDDDDDDCNSFSDNVRLVIFCYKSCEFHYHTR